jgi:Family of unknown function (DUF5691)
VTGMSYADLVAVATVGVSRRPLPITGLAGPAAAHAGLLDRDDPAVAVLDAAALLVSAHRAGVLPAEGVTPPAPADPDTAPELPARAANALSLAWAADPGLLADLLTAAADGGYLAPAPLLPALLDAAVKDHATRPAVAAVLGARGRWLAGHRADWRHAVEAVAPSAPADPAVWQTGSRGERHAYLMMLRDRDRAAARELLAASWSEETGEDRADLLAVLARGLGAADEEFIERALDDPKASVRAAAQILLARLPGSAFLRRAVQRAAPLLRVERSGLRHRLVVSLPGGVDGAALRDGISTSPPAPGIGARAWLLTQLIAAAPLTEWCSRLGMDPQRLVSLPVTGDLVLEVHAGWRLATVRQASQAWAQALLTAGAAAGADRPPAAWPPDHQLAAILRPEAQAARAAAMLTEQAGIAGVTAAIACPGPWPQALADAVIALLELAFATGRWSGSPDTLLRAAARMLPVDDPHDYASALARMARSESCPPRWRERLSRAARALALRRAFLEELR